MDLRPFRGWRYQAGPAGEISSRIAPPYDVLAPEDKQELLARDDHNIVAVDLPVCPPTGEGDDAAYAQAAETLRRWQGEGAMQQDERPALYVYEQEYSWAGKTYVRRSLLAGVRATELGEDVIPHEHTFAGPKADRLKLTQHTGMQISPIFGFYNDPQGQVESLLAEAVGGKPHAEASINGVRERLWVIDDAGMITTLSSLLGPEKVFIADGHHRYTTAMNYARQRRENGEIDSEHPGNFVMFALVARSDPGLLVLPTHRVVSGLDSSFAVPKLKAQATEFQWQRCSVAEAGLRDADAFLKRYGPGAMALIDADPAEIWIARLTDPEAMKAVAADQSEAWRQLDVAVLHKLMIDTHLAEWRTDELFIEYTPDGNKALAACRSGRAQLAVCMRGTPIEAVEQIARQGGCMPHKSTYFYPKLSTGMVLKEV